MELVEFLKTYKDFGYFGLWIATIVVFYKQLLASHKELLAITIQTTIALDKSTTAMSGNTDSQNKLKDEMAELKAGNRAFVEFLRGRDEGRKTQ